MKVLWLFLGLSATAQAGMLTPEDNLWSTVQCGGREAALMVNHRSVAQPTLLITHQQQTRQLPFAKEACYTDLECVTYQGKPAVHFVESSCGNAYEIYWLVEVESLRKHELDYQTAQQAGLVE